MYQLNSILDIINIGCDCTPSYASPSAKKIATLVQKAS